MSRSSTASRRSILLAAVATVSVASSSYAQTWNGGGSDNNWGTSANWTGGSPVPGATTDITFDGVTRLTPYNNYTDWDDFRSIFFAAGAGSFTLNGNSIDLFGKIENNSANKQTINFANIGTGSMSGSYIEINPVQGDIDFNSANLYLGNNQLRVWGNNAKVLTFGTGSVISGTGATVAINQNSIVRYQSAHPYTGDTFINAGRLEMLSGSSISGPSTIQLGDTTGTANAEFRLAVTSGGYTFSRSIIVRSGSSGTKIISSTNTSGTNTISGGITVNAGATFDVASGGTLAVAITSGTSGVGKVTKTGAGTLNVTASFVSHTGGTEVVNGMIEWTNNGGTNFGSGDITLSGGTMRWTTATNNNLSTANNIVVATGGGTIEVRSTGNAGNRTFTGTFAGSGPLVLRHTGGSNTATGRLSVDNSGFTGTLTVASDDASNNGSAFYFNSQEAVPGGATNTITLGGTRPAIGAGTNGMTLSNPVVVTGSLQYGLRSPGVRWDFTGSLDAGARNLLVTGSDARGLVRYAPSSVSNHTGNATVSSGGLQVAAMSVLPSGNLSIAGGVFLLDGSGTVAPAWSGVDGNSLTERAYGTGAGQWQFTSGGFAAKGTNVTIPTGVSFDRDLRLGSAATASGSTLYADASVNISANIQLSANRTITVAGGNQESTTLWTINSPVHEISGLISESGGARILNFAGVDRGSTQNGTIRLSNTGNSFSGGLRINSSTSGGSGGGGGVVVIATDDAVLGTGSVIVGVGGSGAAGMLLFENQGGATKTFAKSFTIDMGTDTSSGDSGFGSWAGNVRYTGTVTITGSRTTTPVHVQSGKLSFGAGGTIHNGGSAALTFNKGGAGEIDLSGVTQTGTPGFTWALRQGTLTSTAASQWGTTTPTLSNFTSGNDTVTRSLVRRWNVTGSDHTFTYSESGGGVFGDNTTFNVESGLTLTFNMGATQILNNAELLGSGSGPDGWSHKLVKTGAGTWVYNSTKTSATASGNHAGHIRVDQGVFDVSGDMGRTSLYLNGGTLLAGNVASTPFIVNRLRIDPTGGKIGISVNATGNVTRSIEFDGTNNIWNLGGTGTLTLASRDNLNLVWAQTSFPNINAGETIKIERDGSGTGVVQINDTAWSIAGTLAGSGTLKLGTTGTGTVTVASSGAIKPGSGVGTLTLQSNLTLEGTLEAEIDWTAPATPSADLIDVTGTVNVTGATLTMVMLNVAEGGATFNPDKVVVLVKNDGADAVTGTLFTTISPPPYLTLQYTVLYNYNAEAGTFGNGNDIAVSFTGVPEPTALSLLALGALALRRRRVVGS